MEEEKVFSVLDESSEDENIVTSIVQDEKVKPKAKKRKREVQISENSIELEAVSGM